MSNCYPLRKAAAGSYFWPTVKHGRFRPPRQPRIPVHRFPVRQDDKTTFVTSRRLRELRFPRSNTCRWCWFYHEVIVWSINIINNKSTPTESLNMEISTLVGWGPTKIDWYDICINPLTKRQGRFSISTGFDWFSGPWEPYSWRIPIVSCFVHNVESRWLRSCQFAISPEI